MGPPGGGKNDITARYTWHYNLVYVIPYLGDSLSRIFVTIMKWYLTSNFGGAVSGMVNQVVQGAIDIYQGWVELRFSISDLENV